MQDNPIRLAAAGLVVLTLAAAALAGWRQGALTLVGAMLGFVLYHSAFGFTAAWRRLLVTGESAGIRAQLLLLALVVTGFFPLLAAGEVLGQPVQGFVFPAGVAVVVGAFLFGVGMQLGGGCGSGTLFAIGGGSTRMLVTLAFFVTGSLFATAHLPWWHSLPALEPVAAWDVMGPAPAVALHLFAFAALALAATGLERRTCGKVAPLLGKVDDRAPVTRLILGPWPLLWGAIGLAALSLLTLVLAGRPWGITSAFALWGAKLAALAGVPVAKWPYWQGQEAALAASILTDLTSVMDLSLILGAMLAAGLAGRFRPVWSLTRVDLVTAVLGGLLMGYGARLAWGCNIGAFLSGIGSGSLHGWLWILAAIPGNLVGTRLRPRLGLPIV